MAELTLVTAADHVYFRCLWQWLSSVRRSSEAKAYAVRVYDLGLRPEQRQALERAFAGPLPLTWRTFPFERYPAYFRPAARTYAWKPVLVAETMEEAGGPVLYLDSAGLLHGSLRPVRAWLETHGLYLPFSSGAADCTVEAWTHPATLAYLNVTPALRRQRQRAGSVCGFNAAFPAVRQLVARWRQCAFVPECLAPAGATMETQHRFDESVLTILAYQAGLTLPADELNLNSAHPVPFLSARHKVKNTVPRELDFIVWRYFWLNWRGDILWNQWRAARRLTRG